MILERKTQLNIGDLQKQIREIDSNIERSKDGRKLVELVKLIQIYNSAMKEISTKLEILDEEFQVGYSHNPIHHLECRLKSVKSIVDKIEKYELDSSIEAIKENINDIAGIRVICNFIDDIYIMEEMLLKQQDIKLVKRKDYIAKPKENGYRSLHIIVKVPVFLSDRVELIPVEIQMRTVAMDYWASLEHSLRYKNDINDMDVYASKLLQCANSLAETEKVMQEIRNAIK